MTGASSGIGESTAKLLSEKGAKLVLGARRIDKLNALKSDLKTEVIAKSTDVTNPQDVEALVQNAIEIFGRVDVLINNAGLIPQSFLGDNNIDEWNQTIDVNLKGVLYGIGAVVPKMRAQKSGHIINIASIAGHQVNPDGAVYCATKFAVRALTEALRQEEVTVGSHIRTTIVSPGAIETELLNHITDQGLKQGMEDVYKDALNPNEVAKALVNAIDTDASTSINEVVIRPTRQLP
ncbi:SDR family oxidoreductase [Staphylococcus saprophyticus]|uniref:SDR family oxidoreductase n=1 Tax=Staphylococcus TaxID=1279 RepID=UPI00076B1967|nr:SDR family oxidoreductase [Staphylococcus saprophyticus]AMG19321.1 SDR family NAD(P)-dependent oxidoreductase [Staphylococcus saprophyticus]MDK1672623.1 SDR family oxidoreductase [Staphylococcus saprophyticus]MDW3789316.1 SDR family oxidoreductase [Staphylococcus saprophyticus]MDW3799536.1 SDR family oxidoreductase [Staphylococcus saprophyticus]MDW3804587.1 SDR family oxidoreductase [Staphylococcus saprophyticus]